MAEAFFIRQIVLTGAWRQFQLWPKIREQRTESGGIIAFAEQILLTTPKLKTL
jgi:hypothetical protein